MFAKFNVAGISYCVLRNYEQLPHNCGMSDLDMWVARKDISSVLDILQKVSKETNTSLVSYVPDNDCPKFCYLNTEFGVQIDLFEGNIICKGKPMFEESDIIRNTNDFNGIKVLDDRFGDLIAFLKEILNNGKCNEKYIKPLIEHKTVFNIEYLKTKLTKFSDEFCYLILYSIAESSFEKNITKLTKIGRQCLGIVKRGSNLNKLSKLARFLKPTGYVIAFLGTDGSGKSFVIDHVTPILNEAFHNGVYYEHMRPNYLPSLAVVIGKKKTENEYHRICTDPHASKPSGIVGSIMRLSYYWLDYTWGYFRKIFPDKSLKTHVWLLDRYYYDYQLDQRRSRLNMPNWIIKIFGWFVPTPDLTICLGGDPLKIYTRKPETSLEEVTRQTKELKVFCDRHKKAIWIDTTISSEHSICSTMDAIIKMMSKRFEK